jgi:hypothetical protein
MKVFINRQKINRRAQLSNLASVGGLVLLLASVVLPLFLPAWANAAYVLMIAGMGVAMIGIYFANRWVKKPRPEESLTKALKSFDDQYRLYHFPSLQTINLAGKFSYQGGRWKEAMNIGRALRYIVEEHLGDPIASARQDEREFKGRFLNEFGSDVAIPIKPIVVFTHPLANLDIEDAPIQVCKVDKLKKQVTINAPRLAPELYKKLSSFLESKTV